MAGTISGSHLSPAVNGSVAGKKPRGSDRAPFMARRFAIAWLAVRAGLVRSAPSLLSKSIARRPGAAERLRKVPAGAGLGQVHSITRCLTIFLKRWALVAIFTLSTIFA